MRATLWILRQRGEVLLALLACFLNVFSWVVCWCFVLCFVLFGLMFLLYNVFWGSCAVFSWLQCLSRWFRALLCRLCDALWFSAVVSDEFAITMITLLVGFHCTALCSNRPASCLLVEQKHEARGWKGVAQVSRETVSAALPEHKAGGFSHQVSWWFSLHFFSEISLACHHPVTFILVDYDEYYWELLTCNHKIPLTARLRHAFPVFFPRVFVLWTSLPSSATWRISWSTWCERAMGISMPCCGTMWARTDPRILWSVWFAWRRFRLVASWTYSACWTCVFGFYFNGNRGETAWLDVPRLGVRKKQQLYQPVSEETYLRIVRNNVLVDVICLEKGGRVAREDDWTIMTKSTENPSLLVDQEIWSPKAMLR